VDTYWSRIHLSKFRNAPSCVHVANTLYHLHRPTQTEDDVNGSRASLIANHELDGGMFIVQ